MNSRCAPPSPKAAHSLSPGVGDHARCGTEKSHGRKGSTFFFGWFVLAAAFTIVMVGYSMRYSFSIFYAAILDEFGWSRAKTAGAFSLNMIVYGISSPIVGTLVDRFGPRRVLVMGSVILAIGLLGLSQIQSVLQLCLFFGIVMAVGINSLGFPTHHAYLPNWFIARRGMALGILTAGQGASIVLVGGYQYLLSINGWRRAAFILALMVIAIVIPLAIWVIRQGPGRIDPSADLHVASPEKAGGTSGTTRAASAASGSVLDRKWAATDWTLSKAVRTHQFWGLFMNFLGFSVTYNMLMAHQPIYCRDVGFSAIFAASIFGLVGASIIAGNLSNFTSDRIGRENTFILGTTGTIIAILSLASVSVSHAWLLYVYAVFFGFFFGIGTAASFSAAADLFAGKGYGSIIGAIILGFGVGGAIGPWLGGFIFDVTRSYVLSFMIAAMMMILSCAGLCIAAPRKVRTVAGKLPRSA